MQRLLKIIGVATGALAVLTLLLLVTSRFSDSPFVVMRPGGSFKTGEIVTKGPKGWGF
jgi:hypothetical protein